MFDAGGLAVSLPARELREIAMPGSIFEIEQVSEQCLSDELRLAIDLIAEACQHRQMRMVFVARPEIFTNGPTLAWLRDKLRGIGDHLCVSDGTAVRVIPGMRNHMFLYRLGIAKSAAAFNCLARRAPEFLSTIESQVNTSFAFSCGDRKVRPSPVALWPSNKRPSIKPQFFSFFINRDSVEDSVNRILAKSHISLGVLTSLTRLTYVILTEVAAMDPAFNIGIGALVAQAYFDPSTCLILRLPFLESRSATMRERLTTMVAGLSRCRAGIPRALARNVALAPHDIDGAFFEEPGCPIDVIFHDSFDFWRHPPDYYARFSTVTVMLNHARRSDRDSIRSLLAEALGRTPKLVWLPRLRPDCL